MQVNDVTRFEVEGRIAGVTLDSPPVNALSAGVRQGIAAGVARAEGDPAVGAIVLMCAGRTVFAGADITEFGKPPVEPTPRHLQLVVENATKPVIAAIHGTALGGGFVLVLVVHYRVVVHSARCGFFVVFLG